MKKLNARGFTLVELMIVAAITGGIALVVMQLTKNTAKTQVTAFNNADYAELRAEIDTFFSHSYDCTASLKGTPFNRATIKAMPIDIELSRGDQDGIPTRKFLSATDQQFNRYGKLKIEAIKFSMPDFTAGINYPAGAGAFKGEINIRGSMMNMGKNKKFSDINKTIMVSFFTDGTGATTITSCGSTAGTGDLVIIPSGTGYDSQSGTVACQAAGGKCAYMQSHNFFAGMIDCHDASGGPRGRDECLSKLQLCVSQYNTSLPGVENGSALDNIHSCDASVGKFTTYAENINGVPISCNAHFSAICNK